MTLTNRLSGRTVPYETSNVRPQVNSLAEARLFTEGDLVREGQPLYRIDAAPYEAQVANARAPLAKARAAIASSAALARRYAELVEISALSKQDRDDAQTSAAQAVAEVAAHEAALRTAQIDTQRPASSIKPLCPARQRYARRSQRRILLWECCASICGCLAE